MKHRPCLFLSMAAALLLGAACQPSSEPDSEKATESSQKDLQISGSAAFRSAVLKNAAGAVVGRVAFARLRSDRATVVASIAFPGIRAGFHGIHIHANDNPANGEGCIADPAAAPNTHFVSADGHYNPGAATHGAHGGDMPNVIVLEDGSGFLSFLDDVAVDDIAGRAVILHEGLDNHGHIPVGTDVNQYTPNGPEATALTQATGNAGNRLACGLIR